VSWKFTPPANEESVAILVPVSTPRGITVIACNLESIPVSALMTGWDVDPGVWEITEGIDTDRDDQPDSGISTRTVEFERTGKIGFTFLPGKTVVIRLELKKPGIPYGKRPDLGIGKDDVTVRGNTLRVRVHSLGAVNTPQGSVTLLDRSGKTIGSASLPPMKAPLDLLPKTGEAIVPIPDGTSLSGCAVRVDCGKTPEITMINNIVLLP
jgi:hypothetical protein